jgi:NAD(P)-dependent dehydrogenase (short-subunit alcohol dehydrogenase family)
VDLQLSGKRALVTGGSRGIGLQVARSLLAEGAHVAIAARDPRRLAGAAAALTATAAARVVTAEIETGDDDSWRPRSSGWSASSPAWTSWSTAGVAPERRDDR